MYFFKFPLSYRKKTSLRCLKVKRPFNLEVLSMFLKRLSKYLKYRYIKTKQIEFLFRYGPIKEDHNKYLNDPRTSIQNLSMKELLLIGRNVSLKEILERRCLIQTMVRSKLKFQLNKLINKNSKSYRYSTFSIKNLLLQRVKKVFLRARHKFQTKVIRFFMFRYKRKKKKFINNTFIYKFLNKKLKRLNYALRRQVNNWLIYFYCRHFTKFSRYKEYRRRQRLFNRRLYNKRRFRTFYNYITYFTKFYKHRANYRKSTKKLFKELLERKKKLLSIKRSRRFYKIINRKCYAGMHKTSITLLFSNILGQNIFIEKKHQSVYVQKIILSKIQILRFHLSAILFQQNKRITINTFFSIFSRLKRVRKFRFKRILRCYSIFETLVV